MTNEKYQEFRRDLDNGNPIEAYEMITATGGIELFLSLTDEDLMKLRDDVKAYREKPVREKFVEFKELLKEKSPIMQRLNKIAREP